MSVMLKCTSVSVRCLTDPWSCTHREDVGRLLRGRLLWRIHLLRMWRVLRLCRLLRMRVLRMCRLLRMRVLHMRVLRTGVLLLRVPRMVLPRVLSAECASSKENA